MDIVAAHKEGNPYWKKLTENLGAFNDQNGPPENWECVGFYALDDAGRLVGGVQGNFEWDWLHIVHLWVAKPGGGLGRELMSTAEDYAREKDKTGIFLDTMEFQARPFYEKLGYEVFGTIENAAGPFGRFFMKKWLKPKPFV
jgi:GNAT superfamily N-acetyltransferase